MTAFFKKREARDGASVRQEDGRPRASAAPERIAHAVLIRPHVTEKSGRIAAMNQYVFIVAENATKPEIAQAVFEAYGIRPLRVRVSRVPAKRRRLGKTQGWIAGRKKAMVTLPHGKVIETLPK